MRRYVLFVQSVILASAIEAFCRNFGKSMVIDDLATPPPGSSTDDIPKKVKGKDVKKASISFDPYISLLLLCSLSFIAYRETPRGEILGLF